MNITICGAGNAAHTLVPLLAQDGQHAVTVYAPLADEAARWRTLLESAGRVEVRLPDGGTMGGSPALITAEPGQAATGCDLVLLALPAFAHERVLRDLAPALPSTAWVGALPARGGFDWMVREVLPRHEGVVFGLQTLPWACRISQWGLRAEVLGIKAAVDLAVRPPQAAAEAARALAGLFAVPMLPVSGFLALTLANTGQIIHPGIMYGLFHRWDGAPFWEDQVPLFYGGVNSETASVLRALSDEVQAVRVALEQTGAAPDLSSVISLAVWLHRAYPGQIEDTGTLQTSFNTNRAYAGLRAPVKPVEDVGQDSAGQAAGKKRYQPWFDSRYLAEDVPYGLLVTRGIAELAQVGTPTMDRVITWAQERLGRAYLVEGRVAGRDVERSRAPQRFGVHSLAALLG